MSNSNSVFAISLQPTSVHAARFTQGRLEVCREAVLDDKAALDALLGEVTPGWQSSDKLAFAFSPDKAHYHLSTVEQARQHRTRDAIAALSKGLQHGMSSPLRVVHCSAIDGAPVQPKGDTRWIAAITEESAWARIPETFPAPIPPASKNFVAAFVGIGALMNSIPQAGSVLAYELGLSQGTLFVIGKKGIEGLTTLPIGYEQVFDAVQAELGLKFRGSAARLFHNAQYDFSEFGSKIAARVIPAIQAAAKGLPQASSFCILNLLAGQSWFAKELATGLALPALQLDSAAVAAAFKVQLPSDFVATPASVSLLQLGALANPSWLGNWETGFPEPVLAVAPTPAPVKAVAAVTAPAPAKKEEKSEPKIAPVPVQVSAPVAAPAPAPVKNEFPKAEPAKPAASSAKPEPAAKAPASAPAKSEPAKKETAKVEPVKKEATKAPEPVAAKAPVQEKAKQVSSPSSVSVGGSPLSYPGSDAKKKSNNVLYIGLGAAAAAALVGVIVFTKISSKNEEIAKERESKQRIVDEAARQQKQTEEKSKKDLERIQREAEKAREEAVAKAKDEAERRARIEVEQQMNAKFMAESPGVLLVTTEPTGASVSVDDGVAAKTPLTRTDLKPGLHRVRVSMPGYDDLETTVQITALQTSDMGMLKLVRQAGDLFVNSTPPGLDYIVNSGSDVVSQGKTPATLKSLPPGDYTVSILRAGWPRHLQNVSVKKAEVEKVSADFPTGVLVVQSIPAGADVLRNGVKIGVTPLRLSDLTPGKIDLSLDLKGYDRTPLAGDIVGGKEVVLTGELLDPNRISKSIEIKSQPIAIEKEQPKFLTNLDRVVGKAVISAVVRKDASVSNVKVESAADAEFGRNCAEALSRWKFKPGLDANGKPLNVRIQITFTPDNN